MKERLDSEAMTSWGNFPKSDLARDGGPFSGVTETTTRPTSEQVEKRKGGNHDGKGSGVRDGG